MLDFSIPQPTAPFVDAKTGHITTPWYLFLNSLFQSPSGTVTAVTASSPLSSSGGDTPDISLGVIGASNFPALTGDVTTSSGSLATTLKNTGTAGTYVKTTFDAQGRETSGVTQITLTTDVSGILPLANGGTNSSTALGIPLIVAKGRATAQVSANASISTFTVGASDGSFEVSANVNVTASVTNSFSVTCTYTDETNSSRVLVMGFTQLSGATFISTITNLTSTGPYESPVYHIRCKASSSITIATSGTFTSVTYNVEGIIKQTA